MRAGGAARVPELVREGILPSALLSFGVALLGADTHLALAVPTGDETCYVHALAELRRAGDPYASGCYFYPPVFVHALGWLVAALGTSKALVVLRCVNALGVAAACTVAATLVERPRWLRVPVAVGLAFAPAAAEALRFGNVSGLSAGAALVGLVAWRRFPVAAGLLLAVSVFLKPVAMVAPALVALAAWRTGLRPQFWRFVCASALAGAALAVVGWPWVTELVHAGTAAGQLHASHNLSPARLLVEFGVPAAPLLWPLTVFVASLLLAWRRSFTPREVLLVASTVSVMAVPILWRHALVLVYPSLVAVVVRLVSDARRKAGSLLAAVSGVLATALVYWNDAFALKIENVGLGVWLAVFVPLSLAPAVVTWIAIRPTGGRTP